MAGFDFTSLSAAVAAATGAAFSPATETASGFTWMTVVTGTPDAVDCDLQGSNDNSNWFELDTTTTTSSEMRHVVNKDVKHLRCLLNSLTGGASPTVTCRIYKGRRE